MDYVYKEEDTVTWVLLFLYHNESSTVKDMTRNGCRIMTFSIEYDDFIRIIDDMVKKELIMIDSPQPTEYDPEPTVVQYSIDSRGIYEVKKILNPITKLNSVQIKRLKDKFGPTTYDVKIINEIFNVNNDEERENIITKNARLHLPQILNLVHILID